MPRSLGPVRERTYPGMEPAPVCASRASLGARDLWIDRSPCVAGEGGHGTGPTVHRSMCGPAALGRHRAV